MTHLADRYCKNPACRERFTPRRSDQIYHTSDCRSEAGRLRDEGITTRKAWKASQPVPERPQTARKKREPTTYAVYLAQNGTRWVLMLVGFCDSNSREAACREVRERRGELAEATLFAIPVRSLKPDKP